jgi:hypothetical protein
MRHLVFLVCLAGLGGSPRFVLGQSGNGPGKAAYGYLNGRWFDGKAFVDRPMYSVAGVLTEVRPESLDSILDLAGGYVIPPFGDAHTHNLDGPFNLDSVRDGYLREGTFYVQVLTNTVSRSSAVRSRFNRPCDLDVRYANGGLTSTLSHPFLAYEPFAMPAIPRGADWRPYADLIRRSRIRLDDGYWFVDEARQVDSVWSRFVAAKPEVVKIFLLDAREHPPAMPDTGLPAGHGLRPSLVPAIVERADRAGLRVAAHVETAADARIAIEAGVSLLAHMPGYLMRGDQDESPFVIDSATARLAGVRRVAVTPTLSWSRDAGGASTTAAASTRRIRLQARNIALLRAMGVTIALGSDRFGRTAAGEFAEFVALGLWSNAELLGLWGSETSRTIFPGRRIGVLAPGYEASFLVLGANPVESLDAIRDIQVRVKQGCVLR